MTAVRFLVLTLAGLPLAGCGLYEAYQRPTLDVPASYTVPGATDGASLGTPFGTSFGTAPWRSVYTDPELQRLIAEALSNGPDGLLAAAQEREAAAAAGVTRAQQLPSVGLSLTTTPVQRQPNATLTSSFLGGVSASWEIDLWGRYAHATDAARADWLAATENRHGVSVSLVANVASLYYRLAALRASERVIEEVAETQREGLRLIHQTAAAGINTAAEERQQESALAATEANAPPLKQQIVEVQTALAVLLGRPPGSFTVPDRAELVAPAAVPAGLPSDLLLRRPDVRIAEARLKAAHARVLVARAQFFPDISLTGIFGTVSTHLGDALGGSGAKVASLGPNLLLPLYAGGALRANRDVALARVDEAVIGYRRVVNNALGDTANALSAYQTSAELVAIEARRVNAAREALRLAELRFRAGVTGFLELLDAQRQVLASETDAIQAELTHRQALIGLYLALGGGWEDGVYAPPAPPTAPAAAN